MDHTTLKWQTRMAPFMTFAIVATAIYFSIVVIWKFDAIEARLEKQPAETALAWSGTIKPQTYDQQLRLVRIQAAYALEREVLARRYNQAGIAFETRLWTRFMGFVTGMVLALVGAAFVLGKLHTDRNELEAGAKGFSLTLRSASPGVMLAVLGTVLMVISIAIQATAITSEKAVYFTLDSQLFDDSLSSQLPDKATIESAAPSEQEPRRHRPN